MAHILLPLFVAGIAVGCGYDSHTPPQRLLHQEVPNAPIGALEHYAEEGVKIVEPILFGGTVTANDLSGNFYRSLVVEDETGGVEIRLGLYDLGALYPIGCRVVVSAHGLSVARYDGALSLGSTLYEWSGGRVEPIAPRNEIFERVRVVDKGSPLMPTTHTIGALTTQMCGRLTRIEGLRYIGEEPSWGKTDYGSEADRLFADAEGREVLVRTSRYADFADHNIPTTELSISGILYCGRLHGEDIFVLKMRDLSDVER